MADDETMMEKLRVLAVTVDPVPPDVVASARAAFTWRTIDAELAALAFDSALDDSLVGVRGAGDARLVTFEAPGIVVDIEVSSGARAGLVTVVGHVDPAPERLELHRSGESVDVTVDAFGRFTLDELEPGPARFRLLLPDSTSARIVGTDWISL